MTRTRKPADMAGFEIQSSFAEPPTWVVVALSALVPVVFGSVFIAAIKTFQ